MKRILIVDDIEQNLHLLESMLTGNGYEVQTAGNGAEALITARKSPPSLVVSDLLMPVMDGFTLLKKWRLDPDLKTIPFIVYTATYTDESDRRLAMDLGADDFLLKPMEMNDFLERIRRLEGPSRAASNPSHPSALEDQTHLKLYSESLIRKLEEANEALLKDIASRRQIEASLFESELRFRQLADNIHEVFWVIDAETGHVQYLSPAFETIWGLPSAAVYANPNTWDESIHPADLNRVKLAVAQRPVDCTYDIEYRIIRPDGEERWIHDRGFPVTDETGTLYRVVGTATDVTARREAERRVTQQAALLDKAHDAIMVLDLDHRILYWNRSAELLYGWTFDEVEGRRADEFLFENTDLLDKATAAVKEDGEWAGEVKQLCKTGDEVVVATRWTLVKDEDGMPTSILVIDTDVTARKQLEAQFLRAQRMESLGTLASGIAHDLNNLLAPIVMGVDLLAHAGLESTAVLDSMRKSAERGTSLVKQVLSFARGMGGERASLSVNHVVQEVESMAKTSFPKNIRFVRETFREIWPVMGDPTQLHQVVLNLCVNARDAMTDGGQLTVRTRNMYIDAQYASTNVAMNEGRYAVLEVIDTGDGMTSDVLEHVFEPFYTTKEPGRGTGLGLPTVQTIVQSHGGVVTASSEPGVGSVFTVYLPALEEAAFELSMIDEESLLPRGQGQAILVVDDEATILEITRKTLETFGYRVLAAEDGAMAMSLFADHRDDIALVLTDMMMAVMDGAALIAALRRLSPGLPVIATSGIHALGDSDNGANTFLEKPYSALQLLEAIDALLPTQ